LLSKQYREIFLSSAAGPIPSKTFGNFRAPDPKLKNSPGGPVLQRIYKICSKNMRKFKMQQSLLKIRSKIQNDSPELSIVDAVSDLSVACKFTTHHEF
jgi:hypothetical protein